MCLAVGGADEEGRNAASAPLERFPDDKSEMSALIVVGLFATQHGKMSCQAILSGAL